MLLDKDVGGRVDHDLADFRVENERLYGTEIRQDQAERRMDCRSTGGIGSQRHEKTPNP